MNCDMAFEHLTDPNRRGHDELQRHLAVCPRCRQMKETLEPAFDLLDAAAGHEESDRSLTNSLVDQDDWRIGEAQSEPLRLSGEAVRLAEAAATELASASPSCRLLRRTAFCSALRYAAVFLAGVACSLAVVSLCTDHGRQVATPFSLKDCTFQRSEQLGHRQFNAHSAVITCVACHFETEKNTTQIAAPANRSSTSVVRACVACHVGELATSLRSEAERAEIQRHLDGVQDSQGVEIESSNATACLWPGNNG